MTIKVARAGLRTGLKSGSVWFDDLRIKVTVPDLAIAQTQVGNVFAGANKGTFDVLTTGDTVTWQTYDAWGEPGSTGSSPLPEARSGLRCGTIRWLLSFKTISLSIGNFA